MYNNLNILNKLQFNEVISISSIIILYEFIVLLLLLFKITNHKLSQNLLSPVVVLNFFIIFVMFLTDCKIDTTTKLWVVSVKVILLFIVLFIVKFSWKNYFIGILFLLIYFVFSNINKVYSCNVKMLNLVKSFAFSTLIYLFLLTVNK
uniref:Uncharacterized protein n=1 Tax=viral metagenome TaxID=1070528 RepID=A0A6C0LGA7_9ZZZZ